MERFTVAGATVRSPISGVVDSVAKVCCFSSTARCCLLRAGDQEQERLGRAQRELKSLKKKSGRRNCAIYTPAWRRWMDAWKSLLGHDMATLAFSDFTHAEQTQRCGTPSHSENEIQGG